MSQTDFKVMEYTKLDENNLKSIEFKALMAGDLHGSVVKLIDLFVLCDYIDLSKYNYKDIMSDINALLQIGVWKYNHNFHNKIIESIVFKSSSKELILLGDVFGDRNFEDRLKLDLITKLNQTTENKLVIMFGNHDFSAWQILNNISADCSPCESDFEYLKHYSNDKKSYRQKFSDLQLNFKLMYQYGDFLMSHAPIRLCLLNDFGNPKKMNISEIVDKCNDELFKALNDDGSNLKDKYKTLNGLFWVRYNSDFEHLAQHPENKKNKDFKYFCGHDSFRAIDEHKLFSLNNTNQKIPEEITTENLILIC